jgi:tetratricopeptide (TPR) repeat protein
MPLTAADWLDRGQAFEATDTGAALDQAVACYDRAIALCSESPAELRPLAIAWMNRGNALQKQPRSDAVQSAVEAYDRALVLFSNLSPGDESLTNSIGAAWLNRGHALLRLPGRGHHAEAIRSTATAVRLLAGLPVDDRPHYRLNLAGAQANLAQLLADGDEAGQYARAGAVLAAALELTATHEQQRAGFAAIGLQARRTLCELIGRWLIATDDPTQHTQLIARASDAVDTGMVLARHWEQLGVTQFRVLTARLFRFGTAFYQRHQVHFLADFVLENLDPGTCGDAIMHHPELHVIACEALHAAREELRTRCPVIAGDEATARRLHALQAIETALDRLGRSLTATTI